MTSKDQIRVLRHQIENNRRPSTNNHRFLAPPLLFLILTPPAIAQAVVQLNCQPEDRIDLAENIELHGKITFAILIWMQCEDTIVDFLRVGCLDSRLPLDEATATRIIPDRGHEFATEIQWQFLPHFFHRNDDREIDQSVILPFIRDVGTVAGGAFGSITKVEIHPLLQDFSVRQHGPIVVVRKTLRPEGSEDHRRMLFRKEKRSLRLLNCLKHPNIIPFLGAYIHGDNLSFLFPCIDMDLSAFFQQSSRYGDFYRDFTFYSALLGLASALSNVHNIRLRASTEGLDFSGIGYHHDLRPRNILVSKETFILADFGMGNLKAADQGSQSKWKAGSGDYLAPECRDENLIHQDVGRSIDVWAFGCLLAEVATFIQMGARGLTRFCTARLSPGLYLNCETSYFHDDKGNIKDSVKQWLGFLNYGGDLPALNKPLYRLIVEILVPGNKRPTIAEICPRLALLCVKSHFFAVLECLTEALEAKSSEVPATTGSMRIWFERERLRAFGHVLCLYDIGWNSSILKFIEQENAICVGIMVQLFKIFRPSQVDIEVHTGVASELNVQVAGGGRLSEAATPRPRDPRRRPWQR